MIISNRAGFWYSFWGGFLALYLAVAGYRAIDLYAAGVYPTSGIFVGVYLGYMVFSPWWLPLYILAGLRQGVRRGGNRAVVLSAQSDGDLQRLIARHKKNARKVYLVCAILVVVCIGAVKDAYATPDLHNSPYFKIICEVLSGILGGNRPPEFFVPYLNKLLAVGAAYMVSDILFMTWWANRRVNEL